MIKVARHSAQHHQGKKIFSQSMTGDQARQALDGAPRRRKDFQPGRPGGGRWIYRLTFQVSHLQGSDRHNGNPSDTDASRTLKILPPASAED